MARTFDKQADRHWRLFIGAAIVAIMIVLAATPGPNRFRSFDPDELGAAEADLWRAYYERRRVDLALGLVSYERRSFGLSLWDSLNSGLSAANAARIFQDSSDRVEAEAALKSLARHFAILARATGSSFDPHEAARLELEWWQVRRETDSGPDAYAPAVAAAAAYIYGADPNALDEYARLRSRAMDLRDRMDAAIAEQDWNEIRALLVDAYGAMRRAISS